MDAFAPGKLLFLGEWSVTESLSHKAPRPNQHSDVVRNPAIVFALDQGATVTLSTAYQTQSELVFSFNLVDFGLSCSASPPFCTTQCF